MKLPSKKPPKTHLEKAFKKAPKRLLKGSLPTPFIIAELSGNHNQNLNIALESVKAIAKSGADAIKLQTYTPSCLTLPCKSEAFRIKSGLWKDSYLWDLYENAKMPWEWHSEIFTLAKSLNLVAFSSPFSVRGVEFLERLECPIYKVASFEIMHVPLLNAIAATKKPVILSLGVGSNKEIENALQILRDSPSITLLHCVSEYPADIADAKLSNIATLWQKWGGYNVKIGLSDHTLGITVPLIATLCGVSAIEKHFILDKNLGGVDRAFSLDPAEFTLLVKSVKEACVVGGDLDFVCNINHVAHLDFYLKRVSKRSLGFKNFKRTGARRGGQWMLGLESSRATRVDSKELQERATAISSTNNSDKKGREFARSLFIAKDVKKGEMVSMENLACVRPSLGLSPLLLDSVLGLRFRDDYAMGTPLKIQHLDS